LYNPAAAAGIIRRSIGEREPLGFSFPHFLFAGDLVFQILWINRTQFSRETSKSFCRLLGAQEARAGAFAGLSAKISRFR
jgi:hypothetical protein